MFLLKIWQLGQEIFFKSNKNNDVLRMHFFFTRLMILEMTRKRIVDGSGMKFSS